MSDEFLRHQLTLQGGFVLAVANGKAEASLAMPALWPAMKDRFPIQQAMRGEHPHFHWNATDYIVSAPPVRNGPILVAIPLPAQFAGTIRQIQTRHKPYIE